MIKVYINQENSLAGTNFLLFKFTCNKSRIRYY